MSTWTSRTPFPLRSEPPMSPRTLTLDDRLYDYVIDLGGREPDVGRRLREATRALPMAGMQIAPDQGNALALLVDLIGARRAVQVGTFPGYSRSEARRCGKEE